MRGRSSPQNATGISAQVAKLSNSTIASSMIDLPLPYRAARRAVSWDDTHRPGHRVGPLGMPKLERTDDSWRKTRCTICTDLRGDLDSTDFRWRSIPVWEKRHSCAATQVRSLARGLRAFPNG